MNQGWIYGGLVALFALQASCSGTDDTGTTDPAQCPEGNMVGDVCAGVPMGELCSTDVCVLENHQCDEVVSVTAADYEVKIAAASSGSCIALMPGVYGAIVLPAGVSLFGRGAAHVEVRSVSVTGGSSAMIRGMTIEAGMLYLDTQDITVDAVDIRHSPGDGVELATGATASITRSSISGAVRYGIVGFDAGSLNLQDTLVSSDQGPGMWAQCSGGCDCVGTVNVTMTNVAFIGNSLVGVSLVGVDALMSNVEIRDTTVGANFEAGGGLSISGCSQVDATDVRISNNADFGLLIDDSAFDAERLDVSGNLRGVWIQHIGLSTSQPVILREASISDNQGVGIGIDGQSVGVTVENSDVTETRSIALPVLVGGVSASVEEVGDGIAWLDGSQVMLNSVTVSSSARASILIDGPVGPNSSIANVTLSGGDEALGILQQNLPPGGEEPSVAGNTAPSVTTDPSEHYSIPGDVAVPPGI